MSIIRDLLNFTDRNQKTIRVVSTGVAIIATIATPFIASKAHEKVVNRIRELGLTTKKDKLQVAVKEPLVWASVATSLVSMGAGFISYSVADRVINKTRAELDDLVEDKSIMEEAISELPEKQRKVVEKNIIEQKIERFKTREQEAKEHGDLSLSSPIDTGYGSTRFMATFSKGIIFLHDYQKIMTITNDFNAQINSGVYPTQEELKIKLGLPVNEVDCDLFFTSQIKWVMDSDHFYQVDDCGQPLGILEFETHSKPQYMSERDRKNLGISFI